MLATLGLGILFVTVCVTAGMYFGHAMAREDFKEIFEDTVKGDMIREEYGLHLEFSYTEPKSGVEIARVVSQWHEYQSV